MYARDSSWVWAVRECAFLLSGKFVKGMVTRFCSDANSRFGMCLQWVFGCGCALFRYSRGALFLRRAVEVQLVGVPVEEGGRRRLCVCC